MHVHLRCAPLIRDLGGVGRTRRVHDARLIVLGVLPQESPVDLAVVTDQAPSGVAYVGKPPNEQARCDEQRARSSQERGQ